MKKISIFLLSVLLIGGIVGYFQWNKPHQDIGASKEDLSIKAADLLAAYEQDETKANTKYLEKLIIVNGVIKNIEKGDTGEITFTLATGNDMSSVICNLDPLTKHGDLNVKIGENIKLKGLCSGFLMDVIMDRCVLVK